MLNEQSLRSSLQVAPFTHSNSRSEACGDGSNPTSTTESYSRSQMTPPLTPNGSPEGFDSMPAPPPVFHNFLRAVFPFHPSCATVDSTVTLALDEGDVILVHSIHTNGWADGTLLFSGARGWLPTNYCDAYDPEEMLTLLKSLLNFWDLLRSTSVNDSEMFANQEFMKGLIAGVRYLLERTHCLTRESTVLQRHEGLRRCRKSMLAELSSLVKTAKYLQERQKTASPASIDINDIIDQMILKAFKIVVKGVRFLDAIEVDRESRAPAIDIMDTVLEEGGVPPTPPAESTDCDDKHGRGHDARSRGGVDRREIAAEPAQSDTSDVTQTGPNKRLSGTQQVGANGATRRLSQAQVKRLSTGISHRVSLAGPSPLSQPQKLVSGRLNSCHDAFLSHLGSFIGRLQLHSQSRPQLAFAIKQSASSGIELLSVVDVVCAHNTSGIDSIYDSRTAMYDRIYNLVQTARQVLTDGGPEMEDVIASQDNGRLLSVATGCVKATGECVAKTKWVIEKMGDFEFEFGSHDFCVDLDLSALDGMMPEDNRSTRTDTASVVESNASDAPTQSSVLTPTSMVSPRRGGYWSMDKPLPDIPPCVTSTRRDSATSSQLASPRHLPTLDDNESNNMSTSMSSFRPQLPPLPRIATSLLPTLDIDSPVEATMSHESEIQPLRSGSITASSSGSAITYLSRDSESSLVSMASTRATTPDRAHFPADLSITSGSTNADDVDDYVESKLLERTYAHELMFNKEGQVTGGSLSALVERLTTHESTPDAMFVSTFYLTFRLFCTPRQLAQALIDRFDYVGETPNIAGPVRLRTHNAFKGWLESHWSHETDDAALSLIQQFAQYKLWAVLPSAGKRLLELTEKVSASKGPLVPRLVSSMGKTNTSVSQYMPTDGPLPTPIVSKSQTHLLANWKAGGSCPSVLDFDPLEIARQLAIRQMGIFCRIMPEELLGSIWTKRGGIGAPNVKAMVSFTTGVSNMVADTVLQHEEAKRRAGVIKHWIKVANQCLVLRNYDALMAITCALTDTSIKRLKFTWDNVSAKRKEMLKGLQSVVDLNQNYKVLRARLHDDLPPCLPFLGMFLTDLTFVDVGNLATKTTDTGLTVINFDKHMRTAKCIGELQRFQVPFRLTEHAEFQKWIEVQLNRVQQKDAPDANAQVTHYRKSLLLEPREGHHARNPAEGPGTNASSRFGWKRNNSHSQGPPSPI